MFAKKSLSIFIAAVFLFSVTTPDIASAVATPSDIAANISLSDRPIDNTFGNYAQITSIADYGGDTIVLNIQDFHMHPEVQRNISSVLDILVKKYGLKNVFVEGAYGKVDTGYLSGLKNIDKESLENLLNSGIITGAEYYSALNDKKNFILGLEDENIHKSNVKRLGELLKKQDYYNNAVAKLQKELKFFQEKYFNYQNRKLAELIEKHKDGKISSYKYYTLLFNYLKKHSQQSSGTFGTLMPMDMSDYPNICLLLHGCKIQNSLSVKKVSKELENAIASLKENISYNEYKKILDKTDKFKDIYELTACLDSMPEEFKSKYFSYSLSKYIEAMNKMRQINPVELISEERALVREIRISLSKDKNEIEVSFLSDFFLYFTDFLKTSISADDNAYLKENFGKFKNLWSKYSFYNDTMQSLEEDFADLNLYYEINDQRNEIFMRNIRKTFALNRGTSSEVFDVKKASSVMGSKKNLIVCVTGGYHSKGLSDLLASEKISHIVATPAISGDTKTSLENYEKAALEQAKIFTQSLALSLFSQMGNSASSRDTKLAFFRSATESLSGVDFVYLNDLIENMNAAVGGEYVFSYDERLGQAVISSKDGKYSQPFIKIVKTSDGKISIEDIYSSSDVEREVETLKGDAATKFAGNFLKVMKLMSLNFGTDIVFPQIYSSFVNIIDWAAENNVFLDISEINGTIFDIAERYDLQKEIVGENPNVAKYPQNWQQAQLLKYFKRAEYEQALQSGVGIKELFYATGLFEEFIPVSSETLAKYDKYQSSVSEVFENFLKYNSAGEYLNAMKKQYKKDGQEASVVDRLWKQFSLLREGKAFDTDSMTAAQLIETFTAAGALSKEEQKLNEMKYGTAGYRAEFGAALNYVHVLVNAQAIAEVAKERFAEAKSEGKLSGREKAKIFVGYDTRFMSKEFALTVAEVLAANGVEAELSSVNTPTQAISWLLGAANGEGYDLAVNITASHNPYSYDGIKVNEPFGGQAGGDITAAIEQKLKEISDGEVKIKHISAERALKNGDIIMKNNLLEEYVAAYIEMFKRQFNIKSEKDFENFKEKAKNFYFIADVKNGTTPKYYEEIMKTLGIENYEIINSEFNPTFQGEDPNPDKNTQQLKDRVNAVKESNPDAFVYGIATDPDGDRMAVIENGKTFTTDEIIIYNTYRLLKKAVETAKETGKKQEVVIVPNLATTGALELIKEHFDTKYPGMADIKIRRTNIGFKWIAEVMKAAKDKNPEVITMGAEESGAVVAGGLTLDKDGLVATFGTTSLAIDSQETIESSLTKIYSDEVLGWVPQKKMESKKFDSMAELAQKKELLENIAENNSPAQEAFIRGFEHLKDKFEIERIEKIVGTSFEGIQIFTTNPKVLFVMRLSGTEPLVKVYAESDSEELTDAIIAGGKEALEARPASASVSEIFENFLKYNSAGEYLDAMKKQYKKDGQEASVVDRLWKQFSLLREGKAFDADSMTAAQLIETFTAAGALSKEEQKLNEMKYGTAGYRAEFGAALNYVHVLVNAQAIAEVAKERFAEAKSEGKLSGREKTKIFVGYDTRFMSKEFALTVAEVLAANGVEAELSSVNTPTQAISWLLGAANGEGYDLAVNITASHNPYSYDGIKVNEPFGGQAGGDITAAIEKKLKEISDGEVKIKHISAERALENGDIIMKDNLLEEYVAAYIEMFKRQFNIKSEKDFENFKEKAKNFYFIADVKNGTTPKYYEEIMKTLGIENYEIINSEFNPTFQGEDPNPDKNTQQLKDRVNAVKESNPDAFVYGIATDPDGDRMAVIENGKTFTTDEIIIYNTYRLLEKAVETAKETGKKQEVVIVPNLATTGALELIKEHFDAKYPGLADIKIRRTNIGFKWIAEVMKAAKDKNPEVITMGAEESGAVVAGGLTLDKDGLVATFGTTSLAIDSQETIESTLTKIYSDEVLGWVPQKKMESKKFDSMAELAQKRELLENIAENNSPAQEAFIRGFEHLKDKFEIERIEKIVGTSFEGIQIFTTNPKVLFVMRLSGTEPLVKVYAESDSEELTDAIISGGKEALEARPAKDEGNIRSSDSDTAVNETDEWKSLEERSKNIPTIKESFETDPLKRTKEDIEKNYTRKIKGKNAELVLDTAFSGVDNETMKLLMNLAKGRDVKGFIKRMMSGEKINESENRAVLHTALRNVTRDADGNIIAKSPVYVDGKDVMEDIVKVLEKIRAFDKKLGEGKLLGVTGKPINTIISIGIGGSDLGPRMATTALDKYRREGVDVRYVSNVDPRAVQSAMKGIDPETTLVIVESKTFTTQETMENAQAVKKAMIKMLKTAFPSVNQEEIISKHFVAVSTAKEKVAEFGIDAENNMFEFWDFVGGRFSIWSAIGLPLVSAIGFDNYFDMLSGANEMDEHFAQADYEDNIPLRLAMIWVWYINFMGYDTHSVIPYSEDAKMFPKYLQQLYMESLGKGADIKGEKIKDYKTGAAVFGEAGTDSQHSFFQLFHQGTRTIPVDFITYLEPPALREDMSEEEKADIERRHAIFISNVIAQREAFAMGRSEEEVNKEVEEAMNKVISQMEESQASAEEINIERQRYEKLKQQKAFDGNRPSNFITLDKLNPESFGMQIALYEHITAVQSRIWNINAFDQWGVELGKKLAQIIQKAIFEHTPLPLSFSITTNYWLNRYTGAVVPENVSRRINLKIFEFVSFVKSYFYAAKKKKERLTETKEWAKLNAHYEKMKEKSLSDLFKTDSSRSDEKQIIENHIRTLKGKNAEVTLDTSFTNTDNETMKLLMNLAKGRDVKGFIKRMMSGEKINESENRAVLHTALRNVTRDADGNIISKSPVYVDGKDVMEEIVKVLEKIRAFDKKLGEGKLLGVTGKPINTIISIGIGGSDLGPRMATTALDKYRREGVDVRYVSNVDPRAVQSAMKGIDPETTLVIVESKTFTTQETIENAQAVKKNMLDMLKKKVPSASDNEIVSKHFVAVSTAKEKVAEFGIDAENNMFEFWDFVGGRFSIWSAIGLPLVCAIGFDNYFDMLSGANEMDEHFAQADYEDNIPLRLAMIWIWYINFFKSDAHAVIPYSEDLKFFPKYLQQLYMESDGKSADADGNVITDYDTGAAVFGEAGTDSQHSFYQLFHQGTQIMPIDFITYLEPPALREDMSEEEKADIERRHAIFISNVIAQREAFAMGRSEEEVNKEVEEAMNKVISQMEENQASAEEINVERQRYEMLKQQKAFDGNRPSNFIVFDKLNPESLGMQIAIYEHVTAVQASVWNINAFDQWGVELGKKLAKALQPSMIEGKGEIGDEFSSETKYQTQEYGALQENKNDGHAIMAENYSAVMIDILSGKTPFATFLNLFNKELPVLRRSEKDFVGRHLNSDKPAANKFASEVKAIYAKRNEAFTNPVYRLFYAVLFGAAAAGIMPSLMFIMTSALAGIAFNYISAELLARFRAAKAQYSIDYNFIKELKGNIDRYPRMTEQEISQAQYLEAIVINAMPENPQELGFKPTGFKTSDGKTVWLSKKTGRVVLFAKDADFADIALSVNDIMPAMLSKKDGNFEISAIAVDASGDFKNDIAEIDGLVVVNKQYYDELLSLSGYDIKTAGERIRKAGEAQKNAMARNFVMDLSSSLNTEKISDIIKAFSAYNRTGNSQISVPYSFIEKLAEGKFKIETEGKIVDNIEAKEIKQRIISEIVSQWKESGIRIFAAIDENTADSYNIKAKFIEYGFAGYIERENGKIKEFRDYTANQSFPAEEISGFADEKTLREKIANARFDTVKIVDIGNFTQSMINGENIASKVLELSNIFGDNILKLKERIQKTFARVIDERYVSNAVLALDMSAVPDISGEDAKVFADAIANYEKSATSTEGQKALKKAIEALEKMNVGNSVELNMIAKEIEIAKKSAEEKNENYDYDNVRYAFLKSVAQKAKVKADLYSQAPLGLEDKELERLMVNSALSGYSTDKNIMIELERAFNSMSAGEVFETVALRSKELVYRDKVSAATAYEIILLYAERKRNIDLKEKTVNIDTKAIGAMLSAA